jgi:hypothetical protein
MKARALLSHLAAFGLLAAATACSRSPTAPAQPAAGSTSSPGQTTFLIVDGWSQLPVPGAAVIGNGIQALTDGAGRVQFPATPSGCVAIEVKAAGFLDRRTCGSSLVQQISLWPVANADEADATRTWVFNKDRIDRGSWSAPTQIALVPELAARADVAQIWAAAADTIESVSRGRIRFKWVTSAPEEGLVLEAAGMPLSCSVAPPWPYETGGFCVKYDAFWYSLDRLEVAPERLADSQTALRALLSAVGIKPHTLPGLMNAARPEAELSAFERKTLGMVGLRLQTVTWPDYDQIQ